MAHGFRNRASELVTMELGPGTADELQRKLAREVDAERFTQIDRALLRDADGGILSIGSEQHRDDAQFRTLRLGRLRKLEQMGLASEPKPGVWQLADRTETVLRELGRRNDIIKTMQRCMKEAGIEHDARPFNIFRADDPSACITGKVVSLGLSDEMTGSRFVVVDGIDGKLHYADVGQLNLNDPPREGLLVSLRGQHTRACTDRRKAVAEIMQADVFDTRVSAHCPPWLVEISQRLLDQLAIGIDVALVARKHKRAVSQLVLEYVVRLPVQHDCPGAGLAVSQEQKSAVQIHFLPRQVQDLAETTSGEDQHADRVDGSAREDGRLVLGLWCMLGLFLLGEI